MGSPDAYDWRSRNHDQVRISCPGAGRILQLLRSGNLQKRPRNSDSVRSPCSTDCFDAAGHLTHQSISLDGTKLVEDRRLSDDYAIDKSRTHWIYSGEPQWETGCPDRLYLIDISKRPARVIAFGVKKACNEFHWASWGKMRSVIALKNNVKFVYEDGVMTLPKAGESLWNAIEPPHAGAGLSEEDAVPFAVDVPLPK